MSFSTQSYTVFDRDLLAGYNKLQQSSAKGGRFHMNPILIVDDNQQILNILTQYVQAQGWPFITAVTGEDALRLFDSTFPFLCPFSTYR